MYNEHAEDSFPTFGLGTWKSKRHEVKSAVKAALAAGYRMLDTANDYNNEDAVGEAIAESGVAREDIFIQCKLWNSNHRPEHVRADLEASLRDLGVSYVDCFVIHWPQACPSAGKLAVRTHGAHGGPKEDGTMFPEEADGTWSSDNESHYLETWTAMEALVDEGLCRSIGLSNFNASQMREVWEHARIKPAVNQCEMHPYFQQLDLVSLCQHLGVKFQSYSPLGSGDSPFRSPSDPTIWTDNVLTGIAERLSKSVAQVVLRWHIQRGVSVVPKSVNEGRIKENFDVFSFELEDEDMERIAGLNRHLRLLPLHAAAKHPDYPFKDELPYGFAVPKAPTATK